MDDLAKLLPCPFCGAKKVYPVSPALGKSSWTIYCDDCCAHGPTVPSYNSNDPEEVCGVAWNTRSGELIPASELAELRAENARLREALYLAANRLHRVSVEPEYGSDNWYEWGEWANAARAALGPQA